MRHAWNVYTKSGTVCLGACLVNFQLERQLVPVIHDGALRHAGALAAIQVLAIVSIALFLLGRRACTGLRESIYEQLRPAIRDRVLALAFEGEVWSSVVPKRGPARHVLEESIAHTLATLTDSARDRVAQFAVDHGFVAQWERAFSSRVRDERKRAIFLLGLTSQVTGGASLPAALLDPHPAVRTEAARALLVAGDELCVSMVFRLALRESLLVRALLASDLKRHARHLLANTIPAVLAEATSAAATSAGTTSMDTIRCLEMMTIWKRAMPSFAIEPWLAKHGDPLVGPLVLALLPYVPVDDSIEVHLLSALTSAHLDVQCAAAQVTGQLKLERLVPALAQSLNQNKRLALASANAMAKMGMPGERALERIVRGPDRNAAPVAMEALENLTVRSQ